MFGVTYENILRKISAERDISIEDIENKVKEKLNKFSDLISREGAAHIVANEYGVKIIEDMSRKTVPIHKLLVGMRSVNLLGKVIKLYGVREFKTTREGKVGSCLVADETGAIRVVFWDTKHIAEMENGNLKEDSIIKIKNAYVRENNGFKEIHLGSQGSLEINPVGETINDVRNEVAEVSAIEKKISELKENDDNISIKGTIVQVFDPRFFNAKDKDGNIQEENAAILNFFFDDGSGNIRVVAFRNQAEQIMNLDKNSILKFKDNPAEFENFKNTILGKQLKIVGRSTKNEMFNRIEFTVKRAYELNPEEIAKEIAEEISV